MRTVPFYKSPMPLLKGKPKGLPKHFHFSFSGADLLRCHCSKNPAASELACVGCGSAELETNHFPVSDVNVARKGITLSFLKKTWTNALKKGATENYGAQDPACVYLRQ